MPLSQPSQLRPLLAQPVAILGAGVSGRAVAGLLEAVGALGLVYDEKSGAAQRTEFTSAAALTHKLVVFSPGFRIDHPWLLTAAAAGCLCLGELDFASLFWQGKIVAITGTNGKTTLTEFLTHALKQAGFSATATGNIGYPFSRLVTESSGGGSGHYAVCEISSFQAESLWHFSADATLWTNFAEDHLERHCGLASYFSAKYEIVLRTSPGFAFVGSSVQSAARALRFVLPANSAVQSEQQPLASALVGTVFGEYPQYENYLLAAAWWQKTGYSLDQLVCAARSFKLGRHRLACVAEFKGVSWWNDSKATNFHAVEAALGRFVQPVILIAGGKAKGGDLPAFVQRIAPRLKHLVLIGDTKSVLAEACGKLLVPFSLCSTLDEAVARCSALALPGDQVLLSPGFASFDMFRGYDHRGEVFEQQVQAMASNS